MPELYGLDVGALPDGWTPTEVIAVMKCVVLDGVESGPGAVRYSTRSSDSLSIAEATGMLECAKADLLAQYLDSLRPTDDL